MTLGECAAKMEALTNLCEAKESAVRSGALIEVREFQLFVLKALTEITVTLRDVSRGSQSRV